MADGGILSVIGTSLLGIGTGGVATLVQSVFGGVSAWIKEWQRRKTMQAQHKQDLEMADKQLQLMQAEGDIDLQKAREERASREMEVEADAYKASLAHDRATYSRGKSTWLDWLLVLADFLRGVTRPVMTFFLCYITWRTYTHFTAYCSANQIIMESKSAGDITMFVVHNLVFMAGSAVGWWFSSRPVRRAESKERS